MQNRDVLASSNIGVHSATETVIRVLCVDDETNLLQTTKSILELQTSLEIETVSSVDEALQKMSQKEFDVIVSDYQMPIKSGLDFLKHLRDSGNDIPFILFTGKGREEVAVKALNLGADRYFNKIGHPETVYGELAHGIVQLATKIRVEKEAKRLSSVIEQSSNSIVILDREEKIVYANPTFLQVHGLYAKDVIGTSWQNVIAEGTNLKEESENIRNVIFKEKGVWSKEIFNKTKTGEKYWIKVKIFPLMDENGKVTHVVYNGEDITEQKRIQDTIWDREERLRAIIASSPDAMIVTDMHGKITDCNVQTLNLLRVSSRKEIIGTDCYQFIAKEDLKNVRLKIPNLLEEGTVNNVECKLLTKNGTKTDVEFSASTLMDAFGDPVGAVILTRDITERKKVGDAIKESEEKYRRIVELSPDGIITMNMKGIITSANNTVPEMTGLSADEMVGKHFTKMGIFRLRDLPKYVKLVGSILRENNNRRTEFVFLRKDGTERIGDAYVSMLKENGKKTGLQAILRDITEERKIQKALKNSEEKYRNLVEMSPDGMISLDSNGIVTAVNRGIMIQTGYEKADFVGKHFTQLAVIPEENLSELTEKINSFLKGDIPESFEVYYNRKDGKQFCSEATVGLLTHNKKNVGIQLLFRDITERKKTEQERRESEIRFKELTELLPEVIFEYDLNGKLTYVNHEAYTIFGYSTKEFEEGINVFSMIAPESQEKAKKNLVKLLNREKIGSNEYKLIRKDGTTFPAIIHSTAIVKDNKVVGIRGVLVDITERKRIEEEHLESEKRYRELTELLPEVVFEYDLNGKLIYVNNEAYKKFGYSKKEFDDGINVFEMIAPECREIAQKSFEKLLNGEKPGFIEFKMIRKDGTTFPSIITSVSIIRDNKIVGIRGVLFDITELKESQEKHIESEKRYQELTELLPEVIFEYDSNGNVTFVNNEAYTKFGYSKEDIDAGLNILQIIAPEYHHQAKTNVPRILRGEKLLNKKYEVIRKDGTVFPAIINGTPIIRKGKVVGVRGILVDITEQQKTLDDLAMEKQRLKGIMENVDAMIAYLDPDFNFIAVNPSYAHGSGYKVEEMIGKNHFVLFPNKENQSIFEKVRDTGKPVSFFDKPFEYTNQPERGVTYWNWTLTPITHNNGQTQGLVLFVAETTNRKNMEQQLQDSEEQYRKQFEENMDAIFLADMHTGLILDCNHAATKLVGKTKAELVGQHQRILHPTEKNEGKFSKVFEEYLKNKEDFIESQIITKNGEIRDIIIRASTYKIGEKTVVQGIFRDITEHKKAQNDLIRERDTLEKVTGNLNASLIMISKDLRILWTNKFLNNILGDVTGKLCHLALNRLDRMCLGCKIQEVIETGKQAVYEIRVPNPEGQNLPKGQDMVVSITAIPIKDKKGNVIEVLELAIDITERTIAEEVLSRERKTLEKVTGNLNASLAMISKDYQILWANDYTRKLMGDVTGKICYETFSGLDHVCPECKAEEIFKTGKQGVREQVVQNPKLGKIILNITSIPIKDEKGKVTEILELAVDVTERKKNENIMKETLQKLEKINEKLGVVGKITRHDTRNKLAAILNSVYLAQTQIENKESALKHLENVDSTIEQIEKILEFSRIYEILGTQEKTSIDVKSILDEAFMLASQSNEIELINECENLTVQADSLLRQIFYNLIDNSAKHGETVTQIKVNYKNEKNSLKIIYSDNGVGIPEDEKEKIFQEGYGKGTGYGLYLIRKICDEYGWTITEEGELGKGAKFVISIVR